MTQTALPYNNTNHRGADFCSGRLSWPAPSADIRDEFQLCLSAVMLTACPAGGVCILMKKTYNLNLCLDTNMSCFSCSSCFCVTGRLWRLKKVFIFNKNNSGAKHRLQHQGSDEAINKSCIISEDSTKWYTTIIWSPWIILFPSCPGINPDRVCTIPQQHKQYRSGQAWNNLPDSKN